MTILAVLLARIRLLGSPLERDEGEYAYTGLLFLRGFAPLEQAYSMKLPGAGLAYAAFMLLFGSDARGIHLGFLAVNLGSTAMLWSLGRRLLGAPGASVAAASFALLSVSGAVLGPAGHATHLAVFFSLGGFLALAAYADDRRLAWSALSGILFGLSVLMKQHAAVLGALAFLLLAWLQRPRPGLRPAWAGLGCFVVAALSPLAMVGAWLLAAGLGRRALFWYLGYARDYASMLPWGQGFQNLRYALRSSFSLQPLVWASALAGLALLGMGRRKSVRLPLLGYLAASFLALCPGLYFRAHYFVLLLPPLALLAGLALAEMDEMAVGKGHAALRILPALALAGLALAGLCSERWMLFYGTPQQVSRGLYGGNPFVESPEIARYIREHSSAQDRIAILGSEPQILFYAGRLSASGHIYMYGLMEEHANALAMQEELIKDLEAAKPLYWVSVHVATSWLATTGSPRRLADWALRYRGQHYRRVGVINIFEDHTDYLWDGQAEGRSPSEHSVTVWRRES